MTYPLAEAAQAESELRDAAAVRSWRASEGGAEPVLPDEAIVAAIRARRSVRRFGSDPLPRDEVADLLAWSEGPIPADAPSVVTQLVTVAAVEGLEPGVYDAELNLLDARDEGELRAASGLRGDGAGPSRAGRVRVWQMADLEQVVADLGDRGYRWAQLEAGIRAGPAADRRVHARLGRRRLDVLRRGGLEAAWDGSVADAHGRDRAARAGRP